MWCVDRTLVRIRQHWTSTCVTGFWCVLLRSQCCDGVTLKTFLLWNDEDEHSDYIMFRTAVTTTSAAALHSEHMFLTASQQFSFRNQQLYQCSLFQPHVFSASLQSTLGCHLLSETETNRTGKRISSA